MNPDKRTEISIGGQVFKLRCAEGEEDKLREAAALVDAKIAELGRATGIVDSLRLALLAAFHFAYEQAGREEKNFQKSSEYKKLQKRLKQLVEQIDSGLSPGKSR